MKRASGHTRPGRAPALGCPDPLVDGDHTLAAVCKDYNAWAPFVKPGGVIVFHDYDPEPDGGTNHLGVRVFLDALQNVGALADHGRCGRCLAGIKPPGDTRSVGLAECKAALVRIAQHVCAVQDGSAEGPHVWPETLPRYLEIRRCAGPDLSLALTKNGQCLSTPDRSDGPEVDGCVDRLTLLYMISDVLARGDEQESLAAARSHNAMLHWREGLDMLADGAGDSGFPRNLAGVESARTIEALSQFVSREQVRLLMEMEAPGEYL